MLGLTVMAISDGAPTCPDGAGLLVIGTEMVTAATAMLNCSLAICAGDEESSTSTEKEELSACDGIPLICPLELDSVRPAGKEPEASDHVYGAVPPVAVSLAV